MTYQKNKKRKNILFCQTGDVNTVHEGGISVPTEIAPLCGLNVDTGTLLLSPRVIKTPLYAFRVRFWTPQDPGDPKTASECTNGLRFE